MQSKEVVVDVQEGIVRNVTVPEGVRVLVRDYDCSPKSSNIAKDENDRYYRPRVFSFSGGNR